VEEIGIIPAIRVSSSEDALFAAEAVSNGGIPIVEVTMTVPGALEVVEELARHHPHMIVGEKGRKGTDAFSWREPRQQPGKYRDSLRACRRENVWRVTLCSARTVRREFQLPWTRRKRFAGGKLALSDGNWIPVWRKCDSVAEELQ
jgi:hypothetical protein